MNNLKKLGFTALAGSLVATSAYAGALDVSGTAKVKYVSQDETETTGNSYSSDKAISFSGSGDLDNGMSVSYVYTMTDAAFSSTKVSLDMGDAGTLSIMNGTDTAGIGKYDDVMPTAGEEVWDDVDSDDNGIVMHSKVNSIDYIGSFGGFGVSAAYVNDGSGSSSDGSMVITYDGLMDGLQLGYGQGEDSVDLDLETFFVKYTVGGITAAFQRSDLNAAGASSDEESDAMGFSFAVNENLSISYGTHDVDFGAANKADEESSGISASYTMGSMTITGISNSTDNVAGTDASNDSYREVTVAFAF